MRPGEFTVLPFRQSTPRSPPGARSAIRQPHQSALFPRLLDPIFWVPQPRVLIQPPWVTGRLRPGPPRSGPRLGRTSHPASSSPVSAGGPRPWPRVAPLHHPSECVFRWATRTQTASPPQLVVSAGNLRFLQPPGRLNLQPCLWPRPRSRACPLCSSGVARIQCPQCAISSGPPRSSPAPPPPPPPESPLGASRCSVPSAHSPPRFAAPRKAAASAACPDPRTPKSPAGRFGTPGVAAGAHTRSALSSGPRKASGPPQPTAPSEAATSIPFLPPVLFRGTVSMRFSCARSHLGPLAAASTSAAAGEPARRLPLFCAVRALTTSALGTTQGRGLCCVLRPADSEVPDGQIRHPRGRRRGPHMLGPLLWSCPAAWTSFGPGKARF
ncbi:hypothetical protein NDU88_005304 [Pleurodeles waltl]|uniref:Uncharacterized protein n=1 Tax=Pleurodeles waltl TaxID=8319 RepID=A0AAV7VMY7_PLEWA|nr:hypothetical protein NDU88_005304 [Pleurodeles waltl]